MQSAWRSADRIIELFTRNKSLSKDKPDWNAWFGEVQHDVHDTDHTDASHQPPAMQQQICQKQIVWNPSSHRVFWLTMAPTAAYVVKQISALVTSPIVPTVFTVFAATSTRSTPLGYVAQLGSSLLMMMSIKGLGSHETSKRGNALGIAGVSAAVLTVVLSNWVSPAGIATQFFWFLPVAAVGQFIGISVAKSVQMDQMPELVASFHSLTGLAAVLVGLSTQLGHSDLSVAKMIETFLGVSVGAATFSGSVAAAMKLHGMIPGGPVGLSSRMYINTIAGLGLGAQLWAYMAFPSWRVLSLCGNTALSLVLGTMLVLPIGGADIPIVISLLNSLSGLATSATGFSLDNSLLVMSGALIASSGAILSDIMCKGINRSLFSVLAGGFGVDTSAPGSAPSGDSTTVQEITSISVQQMVSKLQQAKRVLIIPGYGMAVARCQAGVCEIFEELKKRGVDVVFGIHPVAGRLPGHMNVILSEAGIPYDVVKEMEEVNAEMESFDVAIVLGANDIVNPATATDPKSPIYGMPAIECWKAKNVVVMKRSMNTGYSGVDNPLFYLGNTSMLFGDAKDTVDKLHLGIAESDLSEWPYMGSLQSDSKEGNTFSASAVTSLPDLSRLPQNPKLTIGALPSNESGKEKRIPISPKVALKLRQLGFAVLVPSGIGVDCGWTDLWFEQHGAKILANEKQVIEQSDFILKVTPLTEDQMAIRPPPEGIERKQVLITSFPTTRELMETLVPKLVDRQLTAFNLSMVPRISRAQSMDIMSSMANLAGYKAVINAFHRLGKLSRSSVTAGGNIPAARVFVIGCGVAGLSAIATAHALGATVVATDVRPATKEQVESIGAKFLSVETSDDSSLPAERGGYASEVTASFAERQKALYREYTASADIVITTAMVPGKPAPKLVSSEMARQMKPGSIIVDLAAPSGGNCELTIPDEIITDPSSRVCIDGTCNYAAELVQLSSELFSQNCFAFVENLCGKSKSAEGLVATWATSQRFDLTDVIVRQSIVIDDGAVMYPPPALEIPTPVASSIQKNIIPVTLEVSNSSRYSEEFLIVTGAAALGALGLTADFRTVRLVGDFVLSCVIGHFTVSSVTPALHTPLISVTNALSGIIVVGGMLEMGPNMSPQSVCALSAVLVSLVNVSGGFAVTDRMLNMFKSMHNRH